MLRLIFAALALPALLAAQTHQRLVVISIDGLDARFLNDPTLRVKIPNIQKLMKSGASATVIGVTPSNTWPASTSLVTGVPPWQHGIISDERPGKTAQTRFTASDISAETLWDAATKSGLKAATVFWPVTVDANAAFDFPEYREGRSGSAIELAPIAERSKPAGICDRVAKMFPPFDKLLWDDSSAAQAALYLLATEKPDLMLVHMAEVGAEQRDTGALSIYARSSLENDDDLIGQIVAKVPTGTIVALVSDHGFENSNRVVRPRMLLKQAGIKGPVEVKDGLIGTTDQAVAAHFRKLIGQGRKSCIAREIPIAEVRLRAPSITHWTAAFDTISDCIAQDDIRGPAIGPGTHLGVHDLWPARPGYRSVFIMNGEAVRTVKLGEIDLLQIAPTLADAAGLMLPAAKYSSLWRSISR